MCTINVKIAQPIGPTFFVAHNPMENYKKNSQKNCRHLSFLKIHQFYQENSRTFVCIAEYDENDDLESKS